MARSFAVHTSGTHLRALDERRNGRHDANHRVLHLVQRDGLANDRGVAAEMRLEEGIAQQRRWLAAGAVVVFREATADGRLKTQDRQEVGDARSAITGSGSPWPVSVWRPVR